MISTQSLRGRFAVLMVAGPPSAFYFDRDAIARAVPTAHPIFETGILLTSGLIVPEFFTLTTGRLERGVAIEPGVFLFGG